MSLILRGVTEDDWSRVRLLAATSFGSFWHPETMAAWRSLMVSGSSTVVCDGDDLIAMAHYLDMSLTVPGGAVIPTAGITWVGVAPTHRRRGVLRSMYTSLHQHIADRGYPMAALTASEGGIYGRFGYGPATIETEFTLDRRFARFHPDAADSGGVRVVTAGEHRDDFAEIYDRYRRLTPGGLDRPLPLWDDLLADWEDSRGGASPWFAFLHPDGYLLYRVRGAYPRTVRVEEFTAVTPDAHNALWRALLGLDLVETVVSTSHPAHPLPYLLADARLVRTTAAEDGLWLRIMDIPTVLEARSYLADLDTVIQVDDGFRSDGGRFALQIRGGRAQCIPTGALAQVTMNLEVLSAMYLGVHRAATLAVANRIRVTDPGLPARLDAAFGSDVPARLGFNF